MLKTWMWDTQRELVQRVRADGFFEQTSYDTAFDNLVSGRNLH